MLVMIAGPLNHSQALLFQKSALDFFGVFNLDHKMLKVLCDNVAHLCKALVSKYVESFRFLKPERVRKMR